MLRTTAMLACASGVVTAQYDPSDPLETGLQAGTPGTVTHGRVTVRKEDVPADAAPWWPWESKEDYFRWSGISWADVETAPQHCYSPNPHSVVYNVTDGKNQRCFVSIPPYDQKAAAPILFFAHGSGGNAGACGGGQDLSGQTWAHYAQSHGFNFVCGEAVQTSSRNNITGEILTGGIWSLPEVFNDSSDRSCKASENIEMAYMDAVLAKMETVPDVFDMSRTFYHGCSEGSAFTQWMGVCQWQNHPNNVTAFATHSTGLKIKGDGNRLPPCTTDPSYQWGECPTCKYWPTVPGKFEGLKACIFDNYDDPRAQDPLFYRTSVQMASAYKNYSSRYNASYGQGEHCTQHSFAAIAECMDDGTGRLVGPESPCKDEAPDAKSTCAEQKANGHCSKTWMNGFCCQTCFNCSKSCSNPPQ